MARVTFTRHLQAFFPTLGPCDVEGATVREVLDGLERRHPGLRSYLLDDTGRVRRHVNIFVGDEPIGDRATQSDRVGPDTPVFVLQALSGG